MESTSIPADDSGPETKPAAMALTAESDVYFRDLTITEREELLDSTYDGVRHLMMPRGGERIKLVALIGARLLLGIGVPLGLSLVLFQMSRTAAVRVPDLRFAFSESGSVGQPKNNGVGETRTTTKDSFSDFEGLREQLDRMEIQVLDVDAQIGSQPDEFLLGPLPTFERERFNRLRDEFSNIRSKLDDLRARFDSEQEVDSKLRVQFWDLRDRFRRWGAQFEQWRSQVIDFARNRIVRTALTISFGVLVILFIWGQWLLSVARNSLTSAWREIEWENEELNA